MRPTRICIWRMVTIRRHVLHGHGWNVRTLAEKLEVSSKTVRRDIEFMQDFLGYEFQYHGSTKSWTGKCPAQRIL